MQKSLCHTLPGTVGPTAKSHINGIFQKGNDLNPAWSTFAENELERSTMLLMGKLTISMAIFKFANCWSLPEGINGAVSSKPVIARC